MVDVFHHMTAKLLSGPLDVTQLMSCAGSWRGSWLKLVAADIDGVYGRQRVVHDDDGDDDFRGSQTAEDDVAADSGSSSSSSNAGNSSKKTSSASRMSSNSTRSSSGMGKSKGSSTTLPTDTADDAGMHDSSNSCTSAASAVAYHTSSRLIHGSSSDDVATADAMSSVQGAQPSTLPGGVAVVPDALAADVAVDTNPRNTSRGSSNTVLNSSSTAADGGTPDAAATAAETQLAAKIRNADKTIPKRSSRKKGTKSPDAAMSVQPSAPSQTSSSEVGDGLSVTAASGSGQSPSASLSTSSPPFTSTSSSSSVPLSSPSSPLPPSSSSSSQAEPAVLAIREEDLLFDAADLSSCWLPLTTHVKATKAFSRRQVEKLVAAGLEQLLQVRQGTREGAPGWQTGDQRLSTS